MKKLCNLFVFGILFIAIQGFISGASAQKINSQQLKSSKGPDLIISDPKTDPISGKPGVKINVSCLLTNKGSVAAGPSITLLTLSADLTWDENDLDLAWAEMEAIDPLGSLQLGGEGIIIPGTVTPGTYYILLHSHGIRRHRDHQGH